MAQGKRYQTNHEFISELNKIFGEKYTYEKTLFERTDKKVTVTCPRHGDFSLPAITLLRGNGCPKCRTKSKITTEEFIEGSKKIYGNHYDYSKTNYINATTPVIITCKLHGDFEQKPVYHYKVEGCLKCREEKKKVKKKRVRWNAEKFISEANIKHEGKYSYDDVDFVNLRTKVKITCPEHGCFEQTSKKHLAGQGCPKCAVASKAEKQRFSTEDFIQKARERHGDTYDYSQTVYETNSKKVKIICAKHGPFEQVASSHMGGAGCPKCAVESAHEKQKSKKDEFIERAKTVHWNHNYDYSKVDYKSRQNYITVCCKEKFKDGTEHGDFVITPANFLKGRGCPKCHFSKFEQEVSIILNEMKVNFCSQKTFDWLVSDKGRKMRLDFFLPDYDVCIECQGEQHFRPIHFGSLSFNGDNCTDIDETNFQNNIKRDRLKYDLCCEHGVVVYYVRYDDDIKTVVRNLIRSLNGENKEENVMRHCIIR